MVTRSKLDPLDEAEDALDDMKRIGKLEEPEEEEKTGRTEVTVNLHNPHPPQPSSPQIEVSQPEPSVLKIAFTAVNRLKGWPLAFVIAVLALAFLKWSGKL